MPDLDAIRGRLARWPEAILTPQVIRDEADFKYPCLRHDEEAHVSFDFQQGDLENLRQRDTPQGAVIEASVTVRPVNAFCANVSAEFAESIAKAPEDIRALLAALATAEEEHVAECIRMRDLYEQESLRATAEKARADAAERRGEAFQVALNEAIADERHTPGERAGFRMAGALYRAALARAEGEGETTNQEGTS